jgi:hypothetical protein
MEKDFGLEQIIRLNVVGEKNKKLARQPSYGVSINPQVKELHVNGKKADKAFDYKYNGNVFYVWYFKNLEINLKQVNSEKDWNDISIEFFSYSN